jgi:hypothetical protein
MSADPRLAEIERLLRSPNSVDNVRGVLPLLDELAVDEMMAEAVADGYRDAVHTLRELTESDPKDALKLLLDDLLPRCFVADRLGEDDYGWFLSYGFGEWVNDLP